MKIGILQAGHAAPAMAETVGDYEKLYSHMLDGHGFSFQLWSVVDMDFPAGPEDADGWLISGSKHGAYEDHAFIPPLETLIRQIVEADKPLVGVCFGHQIIAQALGGKVEKFDAGWSVGMQSYDVGGETYKLNAWHQDQVTVLPETAKRVGRSDFCENAMLYYEGKALSIQPHPEFNSLAIQALLDSRAVGVVPEALQAKAREQLAAPNSNKAMGDVLANFLKTKSFS